MKTQMMNFKNKAILAMAISILATTFSFSQSMEKKYRTVKVEMKIKAPADRVWEAMVLDYGEISNFSPAVYTSDYVAGSLKGEKGAERICSFNEKGTQTSHEQIVQIDSENKIMHNRILGGKKLPLDFDNSQAIYRVKDNGDDTSTASYEFQFRTKPAFMGFIAKGAFKKQLSSTLVGLKHYVETGEKVNGTIDNYGDIKKKYDKPTVIKTK